MKIEYKYRARRGKEEDFSESLLQSGEVAMISDKHTLAFCFKEGKVHYLNIDETVSEEKADELISLIKWFIENSFDIYRRRFEGKNDGKTV